MTCDHKEAGAILGRIIVATYLRLLLVSPVASTHGFGYSMDGAFANTAAQR